ncbi:MAG: hypothetical protein A3G33_10715 [Omnitrophica bacterium RIFCSPLOWO2_12_FULL_44_17]|uniref:Uncharacterized protein n=1 Tax=Candidatus Danuiimicrobium aquiferis TaxID=1801832 RepID=A0A1G1KR69_9BACT|nr:MAG: hypothetical protein A3B72_03035 [Omnitrophica bacterium RIFCSPHIGHO2_02_FULL_45_28]OGW95440.1 MAG: hypothetical protein A3G33_10715 [Omnitrophica bacterium RIFCSPLOWO2_12_FULL_44_17]OGX03320.1 MAG: hypothetical protein A3J12_07350 [Omnitrophica bacterium RIFCSPLOWO2_02_FULL_44_11]
MKIAENNGFYRAIIFTKKFSKCIICGIIQQNKTKVDKGLSKIRIVEARGSTPLRSTIFSPVIRGELKGAP